MTRLHVPISLRWSDLDAYGHVNNTAMLRLLEEARIEAFWSSGEPGEEVLGSSTAVLAGGPEADTVTLLARSTIEYLAPAPYHRLPLDIQLWISNLGGASLEVCYEVHSPVGSADVVYAKASTTVVLADPHTVRPRRINDIERAAWEPYLGEPVKFSRRG